MKRSTLNDLKPFLCFFLHLWPFSLTHLDKSMWNWNSLCAFSQNNDTDNNHDEHSNTTNSNSHWTSSCYWVVSQFCNLNTTLLQNKVCKISIFTCYIVTLLLHFSHIKLYQCYVCITYFFETYKPAGFVYIVLYWNGPFGFNYMYNIVACQRGGVSNKPPWLRIATRHGPWDPNLVTNY